MLCKHYSGLYSPCDFSIEITIPFVIHLLLTKTVAIDSIGDGNDILMYIRPLYIDENPIKPELTGGVCINLDLKNDCVLDFKSKPCQCKKIITKYDIAKKWDIYQHELKSAIDNYIVCEKYFAFDYKFNNNIYDNVYDKIDKIKNKLKEWNRM